MTNEKATKAVERLEKIGMFDYQCMADCPKEIFIRRFEQLDEKDVKPEFMQFLDMSDLRFNLMAPICKRIFHTTMKSHQKTIEKNLAEMKMTL